jgi:succinate dehydrogenase / fumarate reductase, cytochrome b subunit
VEKTGSFFGRHDFLIRRLHSLSGLVPVGAYMVVHLLTNASVIAGPRAFQQNVDMIHSLGPILPLVEWTFIFIPLLFHGIIGLFIIRSGESNASAYPYGKNIRYFLQRATGMIAMVFIGWHVWHLHHYGKPVGGGNFVVDHATSSTAEALGSIVVQVGYVIGMLSCVFHLANGLWTMGITWGVWTSPAAQRRADYVCIGFGVLLAIVGLTAVGGFASVDRAEAEKYEQRHLEVKKYLAGESEGLPK